MISEDDKTSAIDSKPQLDTSLKKQSKNMSSPSKSSSSKKLSQWAWFVGLYLAGLVTITVIAKLIKWAMGV